MKLLLLALGLGCLAVLLSSCSARSSKQLGLLDQQLRPCPDSPNCVSSTATDSAHQIDPFQLLTDPAQAWDELQKTISLLPRTHIVLTTPNYIHAECRSAVFGFIDDLEFHLQPDLRQIAIRSAARSGYYDFGVNRKRVEELQQKLRSAGLVR